MHTKEKNGNFASSGYCSYVQAVNRLNASYARQIIFYVTLQWKTGYGCQHRDAMRERNIETQRDSLIQNFFLTFNVVMHSVMHFG